MSGRDSLFSFLRGKARSWLLRPPTVPKTYGDSLREYGDTLREANQWNAERLLELLLRGDISVEEYVSYVRARSERMVATPPPADPALIHYRGFGGW